MDPKGDRERKLKLGMLKLPDAVLKVRFHDVCYCQGFICLLKKNRNCHHFLIHQLKCIAGAQKNCLIETFLLICFGFEKFEFFVHMIFRVVHWCQGLMVK